MSASPAPTAREKRFRARRRRILDIAGALAEDEGWDSVTTRRLAEEIDYSQPVIYQHFTDRSELVHTLVIEGFDRLTSTINRVLDRDRHASLTDHCRAYVEFGTTHPRRYEAMFSLPTSLRFAHADTPPELRRSFETLAGAVRSQSPDADSEQTAELVWACCHGLVSLINAERIPTDRVDEHIRAIGALAGPGPGRTARRDPPCNP